MLNQISYYYIFGLPVVVYLGIIALLSFIFTALIAILNKKGFDFIPFKWHPRMAIFSLFVALTHATLIILSKI